MLNKTAHLLGAIAICSWVGVECGKFISERTAPKPIEIASERPSETLVDTTGRYVQDPPRRSSRRLAIPTPRDINKRGNSLMLQTFEPIVAPVLPSTVRVTIRGRQIALGTIVDKDGWILTKASELPAVGGQVGSQSLVCSLANGSDYRAEVAASDKENDLALLHVEASNLTPVAWAREIPGRGSWLATPDLYTTPAAIGVLSSGLQKVRRQNAVLGVKLGDGADGAVIEEVLPTSGAKEAGLKVADAIVALNGNPIRNSLAFRNQVTDLYGGDPLELEIVRGKRRLNLTARLMDLSEELLDETDMEVSGEVSHRSSGFESVILHDSVLRPNQCGGPLVDLNGNVVGINIARAGRVHSYALPAPAVRKVVESLKEQALLVSAPSAADGQIR
ncbi:MAG TPA: hypothetical protein DDW52_21205 [Planctomycetaceae bacterium]|nr:hypothetical protein [Planctomycetaceae bacterium]